MQTNKMEGSGKGIVTMDLPNFRMVDPMSESQKIYRSSRPDFLSEEDVVLFTDKYKIRCIIDLRSAPEYGSAEGPKLLDSEYALHEMKFSDTNPNKKFTNDFRGDVRKHVFVRCFGTNMAKHIGKRATLTLKAMTVFYYIKDKISGNHYHSLISAYAKEVLNKGGLTGQYRDLLDYSQGALRSALMLLTDPDNLPALINCAFGKDRTGVVCCLIHGILGRSKEYIVDEYAKSEAALEPIASRVHMEISQYGVDESFEKSKKITMLQTLLYIDEKWGGIPEYLENIGFKKEHQNLLRDNLLSTTETSTGDGTTLSPASTMEQTSSIVTPTALTVQSMAK